MMNNISNQKIQKISKILTIVLSIGVIICSVYRILWHKQNFHLFDWIWTIYWGFSYFFIIISIPKNFLFRIFAIILLLSELKVKIIVQEVNFLRNHLGKGLYVIFLGTIMLVSFFDIWTIFGLILIGFGFIIITLKYDDALGDGEKPILA